MLWTTRSLGDDLLQAVRRSSRRRASPANQEFGGCSYRESGHTLGAVGSRGGVVAAPYEGSRRRRTSTLLSPSSARRSERASMSAFTSEM